MSFHLAEYRKAIEGLQVFETDKDVQIESLMNTVADLQQRLKETDERMARRPKYDVSEIIKELRKHGLVTRIGPDGKPIRDQQH
jgi:hypothetical protein